MKERLGWKPAYFLRKCSFTMVETRFSKILLKILVTAGVRAIRFQVLTLLYVFFLGISIMRLSFQAFDIFSVTKIFVSSFCRIDVEVLELSLIKSAGILSINEALLFLS